MENIIWHFEIDPFAVAKRFVEIQAKDIWQLNYSVVANYLFLYLFCRRYGSVGELIEEAVWLGLEISRLEFLTYCYNIYLLHKEIVNVTYRIDLCTLCHPIHIWGCNNMVMVLIQYDIYGLVSVKDFCRVRSLRTSG